MSIFGYLVVIIVGREANILRVDMHGLLKGSPGVENRRWMLYRIITPVRGVCHFISDWTPAPTMWAGHLTGPYSCWPPLVLTLLGMLALSTFSRCCGRTMVSFNRVIITVVIFPLKRVFLVARSVPIMWKQTSLRTCHACYFTNHNRKTLHSFRLRYFLFLLHF